MEMIEYSRGETWPPLDAQLAINRDGGLVDCTVQFRMADNNKNVVIDSPAEILDAAAQTVRYTWQPGNLDTSGNYWGQFWVTTNTGDLIKEPDDYFNIVVTPDLS